MEKKINTTEKIKFCARCGHRFLAVGREVICPFCRESIKLEAKRAAVMRAKRASWAGESVPVRIPDGLRFAAALVALLQASDYFKSTGKAWQDVEPYRSHRRDKHTTETAEKQDTASKPQDAPQTAQAAKATSKTSKTSKTGKA